MLPLSDENPTKRPSVVTPLLIVANMAVFLAWQYRVGVDHSISLGGLRSTELFPFSLSGLTHVFTSMFMHANLWHLMGNMWFLWVFADNVEDEIGRIKFLGLYLFCGAVADAAQFALNPHSSMPSIGASGAISGVLGAYLVLQPKARVRLLSFFYFIRIPVWFYLPVWFGFQFYAMTQTKIMANDHIAYGAHVGGFVTGFMLAFFKREQPEDS
jgi:membrane associated rhomboid family serine protease